MVKWCGHPNGKASGMSEIHNRVEIAGLGSSHRVTRGWQTGIIKEVYIWMSFSSTKATVENVKTIVPSCLFLGRSLYILFLSV